MQPLMKHATSVIAIGLVTHPIRLIDSLSLMQPLMIAAIALTMPPFGLILAIGLMQPSMQWPYRTDDLGKPQLTKNELSNGGYGVLVLMQAMADFGFSVPPIPPGN